MTALRIAARVAATEVEGPGLRFALWVQGCTLACPGCCNPEMFAPRGGQASTVAALVTEIDRAHRAHGIEGITVLGGEPLQQLPGVAALCFGVAARGLGVVVFTGYTRAEAERREGFAGLWASVDTLVTGRYDRGRPEPLGGRRVVGSANQELHHRTARYRAAAHWAGSPSAEIRIDAGGNLQLVGAPQAVRSLAAELNAPRARPISGRRSC